MAQPTQKVIEGNRQLTLNHLLPFDPSTTSLRIRKCRSACWSVLFGELSHNQRITTLEISSCSLKRQDTESLRFFSAITDLCLDDNLLDDMIVDVLAHLKHLERLSLRSNPAIGLQAFMRLLQELPSLKQLRLPFKDKTSLAVTQTHIGKHVPAIIMDNFPNLSHQLSLRYCCIDNEEAGLIATAGFNNLKELDLGQNNIGYRGVSLLARYMPSLLCLNITNNPIGNEGAAQIRLFPSLNKLTMAHCRVGDTGMVELLRSSGYIYLDASVNSLSRITLRQICRQHPAINQVHLKNNLIGKAPYIIAGRMLKRTKLILL